MGYLFLSIALLSGVTKGYCGKKTSGYVTGFRDSLLVNLIRMLLCILIGFGVLVASGDLSDLQVSGFTLLITALSGITTSVFVTTWLLSVRKGAYMLVDVFLMLGVLVTILCSFFSLGESITLRQTIGFCLLLGAVLLMCSYQGKTKGKLTVGALLLLVLCGVANGLTDFSQKLFVRNVTGGSIPVFQFYTYIFAALTLFCIYLFSGFSKEKEEAPIKEGGSAPKKLFGKIPLLMVGYILVMAVCLYLNSYFKTQAADYLTASQLYPLNQGGSLLLSTAMAAIFFKEKPNLTSILGVILAFVTLLTINL